MIVGYFHWCDPPFPSRNPQAMLFKVSVVLRLENKR